MPMVIFGPSHAKVGVRAISCAEAGAAVGKHVMNRAPQACTADYLIVQSNGIDMDTAHVTLFFACAMCSAL